MVARADTWMLEDRSMLLFELLVDTLPVIRFHAGPPVTAHVNAAKFIEKYIHSDIIFAGPFIRDGRYGVELPRRYRRTGRKRIRDDPKGVESWEVRRNNH